MTDEVTAVVVTYESAAVVGRCLAALGESGVRTVVVDNASSDGTAEVVRSFPRVDALVMGENLGFAAAANRGIESVVTPFVLLLNPDAWPVGDAAARLVDTAGRERDAAIVSPALADEQGNPQASRLGYPSPHWLGAPAVSAFRGRRAGRRGGGGFAVGAALLIRTAAFRAVGGFDPAFFLYCEEVDLCYRLEQAGWRIVSDPRARFVHIGGASTRRDWSGSYRRQLQGHLRFVRKHQGADAAERSRRVLVLATSVRAVSPSGESRRAARAARQWLRSGSVGELLDAARE